MLLRDASIFLSYYTAISEHLISWWPSRSFSCCDAASFCSFMLSCHYAEYASRVFPIFGGQVGGAGE